MATEEQIKKRYLQFQMLQQQIQQLSEHLELLSQQNAELELSIEAVQELAEAKLNTELLAPIANGIFVKGGLRDTSRLLVNVGADIAVEKTVPQVVDLLEQQKKDIMERMSEADLILQQMTAQAAKVYKELEKEVEEKKESKNNSS